jgi:hypothetical protein
MNGRKKMKISQLPKILWSIRTRCNNPNTESRKYYFDKGIECRLTIEQLTYLWKRDKAGYLKRPSIDRKNSNYHYTVRNCRFIELSYNAARATQCHPLWKTHKLMYRNSRQFNYIGEVAKYFKCSDTTIWKWIKAGKRGLKFVPLN